MSEPARDTPRCRAIDEEHDAKRRALPPFPGCLQVTAIENARNLAYVALARTLERDLAEAHAAAADLSADVTKIAQERDEALSRLSDEHARVREIFSRRLNLHYDQRAYSWHEIQDALGEVEGKNPNPAGHQPPEASLPIEASGPVGLGPYDEATIGARQSGMSMDRAAAPETPLADDLIEAAEWLEDDAASLRDSCRGGEPKRDWACDDCPTRKAGEPKCRGEVICEEQETLATRLRRHAHNLPEPPSQCPSQADYNRLSILHGEMSQLAHSFRDTLCRVLDTAERRTKAGKPLEQDEIDAMTARLVEDTAKLYGEGRPVKPHATGPAQMPPVQGGGS